MLRIWSLVVVLVSVTSNIYAEKCLGRKFTCKRSGECIEERERCDGENHCLDGSDEKDCPTLPPLPCGIGTYRCKSSAKCILEVSICDGKKDCPEKDDEDPKCGKNECLINKGGCSHDCQDLKIGYKCTCDNGYKLSSTNKKICVDIDECKEFGTCSQLCSNSKGSYNCSCHEGYSLNADKKSCAAKGPAPFLIVSNGNYIREVKVREVEAKKNAPKRKSRLRLTGSIASGITVDSNEEVVYWINIGKETTVSKTHWNTSTRVIKNIVKDDLKNAGGISVDHIGKKIYWTNVVDDEGVIEVADLDGSHRHHLIDSELDEPKGIAVCPEKRVMFWTDVGKHRIESSSMDGRSRKTIVSSQSVRKPTGIAVDHASHRIFWVDSGSTKGHLASSQFDGSDVRIIISELYNPFLGIAVFEDSVYWVDAGQSKLYEANKFSGASKREIDLGFFLLRDVAVYHPVAHMKGPNPCGNNNGGCDHLCLLSSDQKRGYSCACEDDYELEDDEKTCEKDKK